jgi:hypothetical protein
VLHAAAQCPALSKLIGRCQCACGPGALVRLWPGRVGADVARTRWYTRGAGGAWRKDVSVPVLRTRE